MSVDSEKRPAASPLMFDKLGRSFHFRIRDAADLGAILELDEALWIATTAPVSSLKADAVFLELLDVDGDQRIRAEEIKDGIRFVRRLLYDQSEIRPDHLCLSLAAIDTTVDLGQRIYSSAVKILKRLGKPADSITLDEVRAIQEDVQQGGLDQAGIVLSEASNDPAIQQYIEDIIKTTGGKKHPNGRIGVDMDAIEQFMTECRHYGDWLLQANGDEAAAVSAILPLGNRTAESYDLFLSLRNKFIHYFLLCDIKRLNPESLSRALAEPEENVALNLLDAEQAEIYLKNAPLARISRDGSLDLEGELNPYFTEIMAAFVSRIVEPLLGREVNAFDRKALVRVEEIFAPFVAWMAQKPEVRVDILEPAALGRYLNDATYLLALEALIEQSHQTAFVLENIRELERLILYKAYLLPLVNSFVSCPTLYNQQQRAMFEQGTLVMDGRHFTLAVRVDNREQHIEISRSSNIFVIYCELFSSGGKSFGEVAVPVTSGSRGNLHLNKWGIFNAVDGEELHARIVDIIENPISVAEAMIDPFIRIGRAFFNRLDDFSSKAEERFFHKTEKSKESKKKEIPAGGILAGGGLAVAALGSSFAFITKTLANLRVETVSLAVLIVLVLIALPAGISAYYKLSRRDLSTIMEGSGWGMNTRMKLTRSQAACFTCRPHRNRSIK